ncbi:MAG: pyruvate carboxylase, partial [Desulfovibrio sp.]
LQVEHGITECRYGVDLVEEQIAIAFGSELRFTPYNTRPLHFVMQARINCEDPQDNFSPNTGSIHRYVSTGGPGVRLDSCLAAGYEFPPQYDSAGSLLIAYGEDWPKVLGIMDRALREYTIGGIKTTIPFFRQVLRIPRFIDAEFDTKFIHDTPEVMHYLDLEPEAERLSRLVAEISVKGYNEFLQLGEYRSRNTPRLGRFDPVLPGINKAKYPSPYALDDRDACLDYIRDSGKVHFTDTTARDITQSNSGNRFRLAEDVLMGPYLDNCGFFSLENGGGAHFHVAMLANMTYPFTEAEKWNLFAPKTPKQILIRSTNVLGYKPQPKNLMRLTGEMICDHYHVIRCFDFLNHIENMEPFAEVALSRADRIWEPALSLSWAKGFDVPHFMALTEEILDMTARVGGFSKTEAQRKIVLGLKDMAGVCPPRFMSELVAALRKQYPDLILHYHRHYTDGLFVPSVGAAAKAGAHIVDTAIGASVRWYGQGDVLATAAYIEDELGLETSLNKDMIRDCNFVLKQIMPFYDRYTAPYFQGIDYDVVDHGMPGGATSSSQEGAMKQGYIHLLPYMLKFLAGTRKIVRYHDVTPGSQITWNTAFLAVTSAFKRGGEQEVEYMLEVLDEVTRENEEQLPEAIKRARLMLYRDANDAFRDLISGKFGRLPLGFPPDWVYESAYGPKAAKAIENRTTDSPLDALAEINLDREKDALLEHLKREPTDEEFVMYLNHPGDALKTINFVTEFGDPNRLPLDVWFEGLEPNQELNFSDSNGMPHKMVIHRISQLRRRGVIVVRYSLDSEIMSHEVKVAEAQAGGEDGMERADPTDEYQVGSPSSGDLWVMYASPGDVVKKGEELFNISIMKQEKAVLSPVDGVVKRVLKSANFNEDKKMVPVKEGELLVELGPMSQLCPKCGAPQVLVDANFCPECGESQDKG